MNASALSSDRPIVFALLAAGRGERFGPGKLTAELAGRPLWRWAVDCAASAGMSEIFVVTNDAVIARQCAARGWSVIPNPDAGSGIASSIRLAAGVAPPDGRLVIALADMPFVSATHLCDLATGERPAFTQYPKGKCGVPAAFSYLASRRLLALEGDCGAASLDWPDFGAVTPLEAEALLDIDTRAALEQARSVAVKRLRAVSQ